MTLDYLHNHTDFRELINIISSEKDISPALVEKDYWIMHCLYSLQQLELSFELKGGTSLSKGFGIIHRFSEDIDLRIQPPEHLGVSTNLNQAKPKHVESRKGFFDWLADIIKIDGIYSVMRDTAFDDEKGRSGGIRLLYKSITNTKSDLKDGVLLEVGFDNVTPNFKTDITSWAYEKAYSITKVIDNRALSVPCYAPGYTLIEKLQTISTKFRTQQSTGDFPINFLRHYYDVYCLLESPQIRDFLDSAEYKQHKSKRFRSENKDISTNEAFLLSDPATFDIYEAAYENTRSLYYQGRPAFSDILNRIKEYAYKL